MSTHATEPRRIAVEDARVIVAHAKRSGTRRSTIVAVVITTVIAAVFAVSLSTGDFLVPLADVVPAMFGLGEPDAFLIMQQFRLPRALTGLLVGLGFGLSGAIFQSVARNPLASPDILGVTAGASLGALYVLTVATGSIDALPAAAFAGGIVTSVLIYVLAYRQGVSSYRLVLVGIGIGAVAAAGIEYLLTRAFLNNATNATAWLAGSLNSRGWEAVWPLTISMAILLPAILMLARPLRLLQLGDDTSKGLGVHVEGSRLGLLLVAVGLASVCTAAAGPVAFVAFIAPAIARRLTRKPLALVGSALTGALLVLVSDLVGRTAFSVEIPVGIVTAIVGVPYLLWLLARANRIGRGG